MTVFYLDTSSSYLYSAIVQNDKVIASISKKMDKDLSKMTLPAIAELFEEAHLTPNEIDKILVINGPGSFTGVRIGVTIAKVYAWSLSKKIAVLSSLEAMASSIDHYDYIVPMIDARRGYVFAGIYDQNGTAVMNNQYILKTTLEVAMDQLPGKVCIVTNDTISNDKFLVYPYRPNYERIITRYENLEEIHPHLVSPEYLKRTEAEENRLKNKDE